MKKLRFLPTCCQRLALIESIFDRVSSAALGLSTTADLANSLSATLYDLYAFQHLVHL